jgi:UDP-glucose 4-epimerase
MGQLLRGEPLTVIGDGKQTRCFTYVSDAVKATANAGLQDNTNGEIYNIGTDVETSILDLAKKMIEISGSSSEIRFVGQEEVYGDSYEDIGRRVPDATRMKEVLGVRDLSSLEDGLRRTIDWFRSEAQ